MRLVTTLIVSCLILTPCSPVGLKAFEARSAGSEGSRRLASTSASSRNLLIREFVGKHASRLGIDPDLVHAVIRQESGFNHEAVSPRGAMGRSCS